MKDFFASEMADHGTAHVSHGIRPSSLAARRFTRPAQVAQAIAEPIKKAQALVQYEQPGIPMDRAPRWQELPIIANAVEQTTPLSHLHRETPISKAFDLLRTRLRQVVQQKGWTNIGIVSPTSGCGNTFVTTNLAMSLARIPESRTILMDLNMRNPGLDDAFGLQSKSPIRNFLNGRVDIMNHLVRTSDTLAMGLNNSPDAAAAEVLQDPATARTLNKMRATLRPEIVLYDMPPLLAFDDAAGFLPQLDGVLLVSDGTATMAKHLAECERILEGSVPLLGVILNKARSASIDRFN